MTNQRRGYRNWAYCPWPGVATIVSDDKGSAAIFTDRETAGGVASFPGCDWNLISDLANYWVDRSLLGHKPGDVFDDLCNQFRVKEIIHLEKLDTLGSALGAPADEDGE
ncbi:hypothetical protein [Corynebacterium hindlerae]|uniref:hypothetical protein n=1 Tax=Corynebacterium hindlerae TaxID=699041 RepID=UPI003AAE1BAD